jgi:cell division protease FtsH
MAVGDAEHEVFLGRELSQRRGVSEHTARQVDTEVKRILDDAHDRARTILDKEGDLLERIAQALLERETLDRGELQLLDQGKELPPLEKLIIPGAPPPKGGPLLPGGSGSAGTLPSEGPSEPVPAGVPPTPENDEEEGESPLAHALDRRSRPSGTPEAESDQGQAGQEELQLDEGEMDRTRR